jgi:hypothetical protein
MFAAIVALALLLAPGVSPVAEDEPSIEQIVVVAHKDGRSVRDIAASVTLLSRAELNAELATSIGDVFRYVPGVDYEAAGTRFGTEGINIRGIGGNRVAILVDGVPLADQFDTGSFSNATRDFIDAGLVQDIEVLHGPASALYGSAAIGGVVAVRTPDPVDITQGNGAGGDILATWRGVDDSLHGQAMFALVGETAGVLAGVGLVAVTGWLRLDPVVALVVAANIVWSGFHIVRDSVKGLMDSALPADQQAAIHAALKPHQRDGIEFHALRTRQSGARRFISIHVLVPGEWSVQRGHELVEKIEAQIRTTLSNVTVFTHLEPLEDPVSWEDIPLDRPDPDDHRI